MTLGELGLPFMIAQPVSMGSALSVPRLVLQINCLDIHCILNTSTILRMPPVCFRPASTPILLKDDQHVLLSFFPM